MDKANYKGRHIFMVGIGGSSMSGLAEILLKQGARVSGSDSSASHAVERLRAMGAEVFVGHRAENLGSPDFLVYSAAISADNPERAAAEARGIPQITRAELLGSLMTGYGHVLCVCGTHGKTTTSSMIAQGLLDAGLDPTVHIGGRLDAIGGGSRIGGEEFFVAEACEYQRSFLQMHPTLAVVTNIQEDHLDYYRDIEDIESAFSAFFRLLPENGIAVGCGDDPRVLALFQKLPRKTVTFGLGDACDYTARNIAYSDHGQPSFDLYSHGVLLTHISLKVVGEVNLIDALAACAALHQSGVSPDAIAESLSSFAGAHRRFEKTGVINGAAYYHDYGHNPVEMRTAVHSAVLQHPHAVWAVMQPHTYSRVKTLYQDYLTCTAEADHTLVTEIFAARENDPGDIRSEMLVRDMKKHGVDAVLTPGFDDAEAYLLSHCEPGDLVITMGCGNINLLNEQMHEHAKAREAAR